MNLRPRDPAQVRLHNVGTKTRLWPKPSANFISDLIKTSADQVVDSQGRKAMEMIGDLGQDRRETAEIFREGVNSLMGVMGQLKGFNDSYNAALAAQNARLDDMAGQLRILSDSIQERRMKGEPLEVGGVAINPEELAQAQFQACKKLEDKVDALSQLLLEFMSPPTPGPGASFEDRY